MTTTVKKARKRTHARRKADQISRQVVGWSLIALAVGAAMVNTSDIIADLQDWHSASTPSFIGAFMKQIGTTVIAAIGGKLLP